MSNTNVTIGQVSVDTAALKAYIEDSFRILSSMESYKAEFKDMVEAAAEKTGLEKKVLSAYFKARFSDATKEAKEKGDIFDALDDALDA